jgi:putative glutathione S-transferase
MGLLQNGKWVDQWYDTDSTGGEFKRQSSQFRHWIGSEANDDEKISFSPDSGRYQLYVSLACPWAHRTLIFRKLKELEPHIGITVVEPLMLENGWEFGSAGDDLYGLKYLYELYLKADASYEGRVTVPVLWDKWQNTIVNNESADIIRILNTAFNDLTGNTLDLYPEQLRPQIDEVNSWVYDTINNGVYRAGFATSQSAYEEAYQQLFKSLERVESILANQEFIAGDSITEADWRLFTTLIRFDPVYHGHFKCNQRKLSEFKYISAYVKRLYLDYDIEATVNFEHIKRHYYGSHKTINPSGIVPLGPEPII